MTKEELQKYLETVKKIRDDIRYAERRCTNANKKEKKKLENEYYTERMVAQNYISMHLRDFIFGEKCSDMDIAMWLGELPNWLDMDGIANNIEKKIKELE